MAVPLSALTYVGEKTYYWTLEDGKAKRVEVQTGITGDRDPKSNEGQWIEVTNRQVSTDARRRGASGCRSTARSGCILGDLSILAEGTPVEVATAEQGTKVASEESAAQHRPAGAHPGPHGRGPLVRLPHCRVPVMTIGAAAPPITAAPSGSARRSARPRTSRPDVTKRTTDPTSRTMSHLRENRLPDCAIRPAIPAIVERPSDRSPACRFV